MADVQQEDVFEITDGGLIQYNGSDENVTIPDGVTVIGTYAFYLCETVVSVKLPNSLVKINGEHAAGAFLGCKLLESIELNEGLKTIGSCAFSHCRSLVSIRIPSSVTEIGEGAFSVCTKLASINIPESVTKIDKHTFEYCESLASITIPSSVTEIGENAFLGCTLLAEIRFVGTKEQWDAVKKGSFWHQFTPTTCVICSNGNVELPTFDIDGSVLVSYNGLEDSVEIPSEVTELGLGAFGGSPTLKSIKLHTRVSKIGDLAFCDCPLESIEIPESVVEIGASALSGCTALTEIRFAGTKEQWDAVKKGEDWNKDVPAKIVFCPQ